VVSRSVLTQGVEGIAPPRRTHAGVRRLIHRPVPLEIAMRIARSVVLTVVVAACFVGCKKGGGYLRTAPTPAVAK
jgi:hypothetical protein